MMRLKKLTRTISFFSLALLACDNDSTPSNGVDATMDTFDTIALLQNIGNNVILPTYKDFALKTDVFVQKQSAYCKSLETSKEAAAKKEAEEAWKEAMSVWQKVELMQLGPATDNNNSLHDLTYSWPIVSACAVDMEVMALAKGGSQYDIRKQLTNRRGLDASEYTLFSAELSSVCPPQLKPDGWAALSEKKKKAARCTYGIEAAEDVSQQAQTLLTGWKSSGGDFIGALTKAGGPFRSPKEALNAIFGALFYLDTVTKDQKLAEPTGLIENSCGDSNMACLKELESQYAKMSKEHVVSNLTAFRMVFLGDDTTGTEGQGFDDYLVARGQAELATKMTMAIDRALKTVGEISGTASEALVNDYSSVVGAHAAVKTVTDSLKEEVANILDLEIPSEAGGDND